MCRGMENCLREQSVGKEAEEFIPDLRKVYQMLDACVAIDWSMGNTKTINLYCGQDPFYEVIHDEIYKTLHFQGCGLTQDQCTIRPCCDDMQRYLATLNMDSIKIHGNSCPQRQAPFKLSEFHFRLTKYSDQIPKYGFNETSCTDEVKIYELYDKKVQTISPIETSCREHFLECFLQNLQYYGQCCQCSEGWTGIDCTVPVCWPNCVNGKCVYPNLCLCDAGWIGDICNLGKCAVCLHGRCSGPEYCECFYGYEGHGCDVPKSIPSCLNGYASGPDFCTCDEGWTGRICDQAVCTNECGEHGHCIKPDICECDPAWYSSDVTSQCDSFNIMMHDPNCVEGDNERCSLCDYEYFIQPESGLCGKCSEEYNEHCFECDHLQCLECQWPYVVDVETSTCLSKGILEFTNMHLDISETDEEFTIYVRRLYGINGTVTVDFDMMMLDDSYSRVEYRHETLVFTDQIAEVAITTKVFIRPYYETSNDDDQMTETTFIFYLEYPTGGGELGYSPNITVRYFDDESIFDAEFSYATLTGIRPREQFSTSQLPEGPHETRIELDTGQNYTVSVYMNYQQDWAKEDGGDVCYLIQRDAQRNFLREVSRTSHVGSNRHDMEFQLLEIDLKFIHVYCSVPGYMMQYHANTLFEGKPFIQRIERRLPEIVNQYEIKQFSFFTLNVTFFATFDIAASSEELTLSLFTAQYTDTEVLVNGVVVIDTGYVRNCPNYEYIEKKRVSITPERYEERSCCAVAHTGTFNADQQRSYHIEIRYRQWTKPRNGLCIQLFRQSDSLEYDTIDLEARAAVELDDSPFIVHPVLNSNFLDIEQSHVIRVVHYNPNTRTTLTEFEWQACVPNLYELVHRFFNFQLFDLSEFNVIIQLTADGFVIQSSSYYDEVQRKHLLNLEYCGPINDDQNTQSTQGTLSITYDGKHVTNSPQTVTILPGPWVVEKSDYIEDSGEYGCLRIVNCYVRIDPRDAAFNLIRLPGLIEEGEFTFLLQGPFGNDQIEPGLTYLLDLAQSPIDPFEYRIVLSFQSGGMYQLYSHFNETEAPTFPLTILVSSIQVDSSTTQIVDLETMDYQICTIDMLFDTLLLGDDGGALTNSDYDLQIQLVSDDTGQTYEPTSTVKLSSELYQSVIVAEVRGVYVLLATLVDSQTGDFVGRVGNTPFNVYWDSHYAYYLHSTVAYPLEAYTGFPETFQVQVRDRVQNLYNAQTHQDHVGDELVYRLNLKGSYTSTGEVVDQDIELVNINLWSGLFTFRFQVDILYDSLHLQVEIYSWDDTTQTYSYTDVPGSPFEIKLMTFLVEEYCLSGSQVDLIVAGFGYTNKTTIEEQPASVIAGQEFTMKIATQGIFQHRHVQSQTSDLVDDYLLMLEFVREDDQGEMLDFDQSCVCSPENQIYCKLFSGSYDECVLHRQCTWRHNSTTTQHFVNQFGLKIREENTKQAQL